MPFTRPIAATIGLCLILGACSSSTGPSASPIAASGSPVPTISIGPVEPSTSPSPSAPPSAAPPSASPKPTPAPTLRPAETELVGALRADSAVGCVPRRTDLPLGATAGVECHPADSLVAAVGIYGFVGATTPEPALAAYLDRMKKQNVATGSGDCAKGTPGDHAWPSYLPDEGDDGTGLRPTRAGCFLDANGIANIRVTCYGDVYIGVLGNTKELALLNAWTWKVANGESTDRDPPGICARPD
jgi:hypothetical protein